MILVLVISFTKNDQIEFYLIKLPILKMII